MAVSCQRASSPPTSGKSLGTSLGSRAGSGVLCSVGPDRGLLRSLLIAEYADDTQFGRVGEELTLTVFSRA